MHPIPPPFTSPLHPRTFHFPRPPQIFPTRDGQVSAPCAEKAASAIAPSSDKSNTLHSSTADTIVEKPRNERAARSFKPRPCPKTSACARSQVSATHGSDAPVSWRRATKIKTRSGIPHVVSNLCLSVGIVSSVSSSPNPSPWSSNFDAGVAAMHEHT